MAFHLALALLAAQPAPVDPVAHAPAPKAEKLICKRAASTESRMRSKRTCKTAAQWRADRGQVEEVGLGQATAGKTR